MPTIELTRISEYANRVRKIKVLLDGRKIGTISNGETKVFDVPEGEHNLQVKIDWLVSNAVEFEANEQEVKRFKTFSFARNNPLGIFGAIYYITIASDKYLRLEEILD